MIDDKPIHVIHTMGSGRSGSTLLNIIMNNQPDVISIGELTYYTRTTLVNGEYCSCGERTVDCEFWSRVYDRWNELCPGVDGYRDLQKRYERYRSLPRLLRQYFIKDMKFILYGEQTLALYQAIQDISDCRIIADSSKSPIRVLALSMFEGLDLYALHVVRDVRGVVWSSKKPLRKDLKSGVGWDAANLSWWQVALQWWWLNFISNILRGLIKNSILVRFEDLLSNPGETLERIGNLLNVNYVDNCQRLLTQEPIDIVHLVAGNRLRMNKKIVLRNENPWIEKMPKREQKRIWCLTRAMMRKYGYTKPA